MKRIIILSVLIVLGYIVYSRVMKSESTNPSHLVGLYQDEKGLDVEGFNKKVSASSKIVLVYFKASWCVPCIKLKPEMVELEGETKDYCEILSIDVDDNPKVAEHFEINTLPMFMVFKNGKRMWENVGSLSKTQLKSRIDLYK